MAISIEYPFSGTYQVSQTSTGTFSHTDDPATALDDYWVAAYDFALPSGTPVLAVAPGIVVDYRQAGSPSHGFGSFITIQHNPGTANEFYATYAHLSANSIIPARGDFVSTGTEIGLSGDTGVGTGPHLHFQFSSTKFTHSSSDVLALATDNYDFLIDFNGIRPAQGQNVTGQGTPPPSGPDLTVDNVSISNPSVVLGDSIDVSYNIHNDGNASAGNTLTRFVISTDMQLSSDDVAYLDSAPQIAANGLYSGSTDVDTSIISAPGNYYLLVVADHLNSVTESNENNNVSQAIPFTVTTGGTGGPGPADLRILNARADHSVIQQGGTTTIRYDVANFGNTDAASSLTGIYISTDSVFDAGDVLIDSDSVSVASGAIDPESEFLGTLANYGPGNYWLFAVADYQNVIDEGQHEGNNVSAPVAITISGGSSGSLPDLIADSFSVTSTLIGPNDTFDASWQIANIGAGDQPSQGYSGLYLSTDSNITTNDTLIHDETFSRLDAGQRDTNEGEQGLALPAGLAPGTYWLGVIADNRNGISESNESNNVSNIIQISVLPSVSGPDLIASNLSLGSTSWDDGDTISVSWDIVNIGGTSASASASSLYISTNSTITTSDILLATDTSTGTMAPGFVNSEGPASGNFTFDIASLGLSPGNYYVGVLADVNNVIAEDDESNNVSNLVQVNVNAPPPPSGPDLIASNLSLGSTSWDDGDTISVSWDIVNIGGTSASASASSLYISTNSTITTSDILLATDTSTGTMAPGFVNSEGPASGNFTFDIASLGLSPGNYYVGVLADVNNVIAEDDESNNVSNLVQVNVNAPPPPPPPPPTVKKLTTKDDKFVRDTATKDFEIYGRAGDDIIKTGSGNDILKGNSGKDRLVAGTGDDFLFGGSKNDKLYGGADNDVLNGGKGKDKLIAGSGDDLLIGGGGADHFIFRPSFESVTVADFSGNDVIDLRAMHFSSVNAALSAASMNGSDAIFDFGGGDVLVLQNVDFTTLTGSDFLI